jgi:F-type H+-transporting ATPase subunit b
MNSKRIWKNVGMAAGVVAMITVTATLLHATGDAETAGHGAAAAHGGGPSSEKLWDLLWRTLNFAALVLILVKFLAKPLANALKGRQAAIRNQFNELEAQKAEAAAKYQEYEDKLAKIETEVTAIIENAVAQAETEKSRIIEEANRAAADLKRQAEMAVQHELAEAKLRLRAEAAEQAMGLAADLISKNLQDNEQVTLIENYLDKVGAIQ